MLKKILSISGKPGLYRLISYGNKIIVVEGLADKKRMPAYSNYKIISLGDIAIYTSGEEVPLGNVLDTIFKKYEGKALDPANYKTAEQLQEFFGDILPDYDRERVYNTDIKKVIQWYNILVNAGETNFLEEEKTEEE
ncbi:MAG: DUF5606 domain-containing protein [Bacteroidales bacterium]|nr:DUF5606 domain-containing protein [Bacteroidales bacterium]